MPMEVMESTWSWIREISGLNTTATPGVHQAGSCRSGSSSSVSGVYNVSSSGSSSVSGDGSIVVVIA